MLEFPQDSDGCVQLARTCPNCSIWGTDSDVWTRCSEEGSPFFVKLLKNIVCMQDEAIIDEQMPHTTFNERVLHSHNYFTRLLRISTLMSR